MYGYCSILFVSQQSELCFYSARLRAAHFLTFGKNVRSFWLWFGQLFTCVATVEPYVFTRGFVPRIFLLQKNARENKTSL